MLVLTQRAGEAVHIGADIIVRVLRITPTQVQIGIEAPKHINVLRGKLKHALEADGTTVYTEKPDG